jgi:hypothetical protein
MNFITWLSKRFIRAALAGPRIAYSVWREMLPDFALGGTPIAIILLIFIWFSVLVIMVVGLGVTSNLIGWLWAIMCVGLLVGTVIEYQYQIYRREVTSTFNSLRNKEETW